MDINCKDVVNSSTNVIDELRRIVTELGPDEVVSCMSCLYVLEWKQ